MKSVNICFGVILALLLVCSNPAFAGDGGSIAADGMLSAREMRAVIKAGGTITSQSNVLNGGVQVRFNGNTAPLTNANQINTLNTQGYSGNDRSDMVISGKTIGSIINYGLANPQQITTYREDARFGGHRGRSESMAISTGAIRQFVGNAPPVSAGNPGTSITAGGTDASGGVKSFSGPQSYADYNKNGKGDRAEAWRQANAGKTNYYGAESSVKTITSPLDLGTGGVKKPYVSDSVNVGANIYMPKSLLDHIDQVKLDINRPVPGVRSTSGSSKAPAITAQSFFSTGRLQAVSP